MVRPPAEVLALQSDQIARSTYLRYARLERGTMIEQKILEIQCGYERHKGRSR